MRADAALHQLAGSVGGCRLSGNEMNAVAAPLLAVRLVLVHRRGLRDLGLRGPRRLDPEQRADRNGTGGGGGGDAVPENFST